MDSIEGQPTMTIRDMLTRINTCVHHRTKETIDFGDCYIDRVAEWAYYFGKRINFPWETPYGTEKSGFRDAFLWSQESGWASAIALEEPTPLRFSPTLNISRDVLDEWVGRTAKKTQKPGNLLLRCVSADTWGAFFKRGSWMEASLSDTDHHSQEWIRLVLWMKDHTNCRLKRNSKFAQLPVTASITYCSPASTCLHWLLLHPAAVQILASVFPCCKWRN
jgi:hypothetical protein